MAITSIAGQVTGLSVDTRIGYNISGSAATPAVNATATPYTQSVRMDFRIDNHPAFMKVKVNLSNGDMVTAGGIERPGEFEVFALHNHTTKTLYWIPSYPTWLIALVFLFGFMFLGVFVGIFIIGVGAYMLVTETNKKRIVNQAMALVKNAPVPTSKPS